MAGGVSSPNYTISFVNGTLAIVKGAVSMSLSASPEPSGFGMPMTFTATVSAAAPAAGAPGGSIIEQRAGRVLFMIDGEVVGDPAGVEVAFVSGSTVRATLSVPDLAHGRHKVTATYLGDPVYKGSSGALTQTVN